MTAEMLLVVSTVTLSFESESEDGICSDGARLASRYL